MNTKVATSTFLDDLGKIGKIRTEVANYLNQINQAIKTAENEGENKSGKLGLERETEDIDKVSNNFRQGVFRLLVLGDMKRGKSTLLNALIGENLLPSDVNPCTALLTFLRYGKEKKVTIYFNDGTAPATVDFKSFKSRYTIDPTEAKKLEQEQKQAFPNVDYAVVEYPLPLLEKGIEIVDSPGLNDTEARNALSLGYINNCHAILFVLRASQPCTLAERRYLENYLKGRGLTIFFLINAWDQVKESLIDPDDPEELAEAEAKLQRVFKANLGEYCQVDGYDIYDERVFELSSLLALRQRIKNTHASLEGTGFPPFLNALNIFLTQERAVAELRQARSLARQSHSRVQEAVELRIPLLGKDVDELKAKMSSVESDFAELRKIRDNFQADIKNKRDSTARTLANSFSEYVLNLGNTFEADFLRYQPNLNFLDFLSGSKREAFESQLKKAFEQYLNDKSAQWTKKAEKEMDTAFSDLARIAKHYGSSYHQVTTKITEKLTGQKLPPIIGNTTEDDAPGWAKWAAGIFSLARGNLAGVAMAGAGFDWKNIMLNFIATLGMGAIITTITGIVLGPIGLALLGLGVGVVQADQARKEIVKAAKKELVKYLPQVAQEQSPKVKEAIIDCFDLWEKEVTARINDDIKAHQEQLDNLVQQKESQEIDQKAESERLEKLVEDVATATKGIEGVYQGLLTGVAYT